MRKHRPDFAIALIVLALMSASLIIVYAIGPRVAQALNSQYGTEYGDTYFLIRHAFAVVMSVAAILAGYFVKYEKVGKYAKTLVFISAGLCLLVKVLAMLHVDALVTCDKGACRALRIPGIGIGFMPSEIFKVAILFYLSWLIKDRREKKELTIFNSDFDWNDLKEQGPKAILSLFNMRFVLPFVMLMMSVVILVGWWESDFGSTVVIATMSLAMLWIGKMPLKDLLAILAVGGIIAAILIFGADYRIQRITNEDSYHQESSLISMGTGGIMGVGLGNSIQATGYLPEALSDSIFSIICETWGFVGASAVLIAFFVLFWRMITVSQRTLDLDKRLFVIGVFAWIIAHVIINVGGMTGVTPMKGITLPFLSYGGTSMMFVAYATGVVLQISGWTAREAIEEKNENTSSRRGQRGTRYSSSRGRS
ncbi:FtsW/RodA/SpoVE family cell cycle protein [Candidatus Saccharibacteria bacterium]|nr:FtsW/RodA/SpoVE family cell cycle protein [Candidatus Saccharibacteria bacterium]